MYRLMIVAALLAVPAAASAQMASVENATPGALAGRSPHHIYRPAYALTSCPTAMHSLPSGKLPVYGVAHVARDGCEERRVADAGSSSVRATR